MKKLSAVPEDLFADRKTLHFQSLVVVMIADSKCLLKKFASVHLAEDIHYLNIKLRSSLFYEYRYDGKLCLASLKGTLSEEAIFFLNYFPK